MWLGWYGLGPNSPAHYEVATSGEELGSVWAALQLDGEPPPVDFGLSVVVGVATVDNSTKDCWGSIDNVTSTSGRVDVDFGAGAAGCSATEGPRAIVVELPTTDPPTEVYVEGIQASLGLPAGEDREGRG